MIRTTHRPTEPSDEFLDQGFDRIRAMAQDKANNEEGLAALEDLRMITKLAFRLGLGEEFVWMSRRIADDLKRGDGGQHANE